MLPACDVETHESTQFPKNLLSAWYSSLIRRSGCIGDLAFSVQTSIVEAYYVESLACLAAARDVDESIEILDEFSGRTLLGLFE